MQFLMRLMSNNLHNGDILERLAYKGAREAAWGRRAYRSWAKLVNELVAETNLY